MKKAKSIQPEQKACCWCSTLGTITPPFPPTRFCIYSCCCLAAGCLAVRLSRSCRLCLFDDERRTSPLRTKSDKKRSLIKCDALACSCLVLIEDRLVIFNFSNRSEPTSNRTGRARSEKNYMKIYMTSTSLSAPRVTPSWIRPAFGNRFPTYTCCERYPSPAPLIPHFQESIDRSPCFIFSGCN